MSNYIIIITRWTATAVPTVCEVVLGEMVEMR